MLTERQQEIWDHAIALISEKGIQGLTMKNLSKRLGISEPAIYRHYENKIDILVSLLDYRHFGGITIIPVGQSCQRVTGDNRVLEKAGIAWKNQRTIQHGHSGLWWRHTVFATTIIEKCDKQTIEFERRIGWYIDACLKLANGC